VHPLGPQVVRRRLVGAEVFVRRAQPRRRYSQERPHVPAFPQVANAERCRPGGGDVEQTGVPMTCGNGVPSVVEWMFLPSVPECGRPPGSAHRRPTTTALWRLSRHRERSSGSQSTPSGGALLAGVRGTRTAPRLGLDGELRNAFLPFETPSDPRHHGSGPSSFEKVPVGPSGADQARGGRAHGGLLGRCALPRK